MLRRLLTVFVCSYDCINVHLPTHGTCYFGLQQGWAHTKRAAGGQLILNSLPQVLQAALAGARLTLMLEDTVQTHLADGSVVPSSMTGATFSWLPSLLAE
jgi:DNA-binding transcriptional LysR family regulator